MTDKTDSIAINSEAVREGAKGVRFAIPSLGDFVSGFVVRFQGKPYAYVNQCAHVPVELDWNEGDFFTVQKDYLICSTHGAHYRPENGFCVMGPCKGRSLKSIEVMEQNDQIVINLSSINKI